MSGSLYSTPREAFSAGLRDFVPLAPGMSAWALVTGVAMAKSGLSVLAASGLGLIGFAGAAQLAALPYLVAGAPLLVPVITALMVNLRFVIYSAGLAPHLRGLPVIERVAAGYLVSDLGFVLFIGKGPDLYESPYRAYYYWGVSLAIGLLWHAACFTGLFGASVIPAQWGLDFAGTLALLALLVPMLARRPSLAAAIVAGALSLLLRSVPYRAGVLAAILCGIAAAVVIDRRTEAP